ncbi:hypothetical protein GH714_030852 [Hevea brasiliensis]|uniref:Uncharacterized protein n=1 Tax=Hevea brasiliensis TaxID=3981 RepID=A0A6A6LNX3_HEVBR|nr:hypothetical protein GH714_030852 [Hevea brasiliensis]
MIHEKFKLLKGTYKEMQSQHNFIKMAKEDVNHQNLELKRLLEAVEGQVVMVDLFEKHPSKDFSCMKDSLPRGADFVALSDDDNEVSDDDPGDAHKLTSDQEDMGLI